jgi:Asp-tRNA(Asn)/Glu-tRNA(Gln) amidotransferase A subunit family amidase
MAKGFVRTKKVKPQKYIYFLNVKNPTIFFLQFFFRKLKIGFFMSDGKFLNHPGCSRAVKEAISLLKKHGHTIIEVSLRNKILKNQTLDKKFRL